MNQSEYQEMSGYEVDPAGQEVIGSVEIRMTDLAEMDATDQLKFMREWFLANYEDPAHSLPYESREGGYIWIYGGPYDPHEELHGKFGEFVPEKVIETLGEELLYDCHEWAAQIDLSDDDPYGFDNIAEPAEYFDEYRLAMDGNRALLAIDVPDSDRNTFYGMVFVNLITIMETYLSDTFIGLVPRSERLMRKFVATTPEFKGRRFSLAEIYDSLDQISETTKKYLGKVVWHRLGKVQNMYRDTLNVSFPERLEDIFRAIEVRHALVHRNGNIEGVYVVITKERIQELAREIDRFICLIAEQIKHLDDQDLPF